MTVFILAVTIALSVSFLCSVLEACLLSLSTTDIARMTQKNPVSAGIWKNFKDNIQRPIAVILIVNTFAHTIGASVAGAQFDALYGHKWIALFSITFSFAMIQWTEILPKTLGVRYNNAIAAVVGVPLQFMVKMFSPIVYLIQMINKPFEGKKKNVNKHDALDDIEVLARFASLNNMISADQEAVLSHTLELAERKTCEIMVEKADMKFLSTDMNLMQALIEAHIHHHTRLPLINGKNDNDVLGYVNFKDIVSALQTNPKDPTLKGICRPILEVQVNDTLAVLLHKLTKSYQHIAIVKDENAVTVGVVTLEDIIEAIVGDIHDEYDVLPTYFYQIADNRYIAGGGVHCEDVQTVFNISLPDGKPLLSDWMIDRFEKTPRAEERTREGELTFIVRKVSRSRIFEVVIEKND